MPYNVHVYGDDITTEITDVDEIFFVNKNTHGDPEVFTAEGLPEGGRVVFVSVERATAVQVECISLR